MTDHQEPPSVNYTLLRKSIKDCRLLLLCGALLLFGFCWLRVWVISQLETPRIAVVVSEIWDKIESYTTVSFKQLISFPGRVALTFVEPVVIFMMVIFAIARGSDVVSGELNRGTMEILLAQPLSRMQVLWHQAGITILGMFLLASAAWLGTLAGLLSNSAIVYVDPPGVTIPILNYELTWPFAEPEAKRVPMTEVCHPWLLIPAALNLFCLGFCISGIATMVSAADRYRWRTIGVVAGFFIIQFILKGLGMTAEWLNWLLYFSFMTVYDPQLVVAVAADQPDYTWSFWMPSMKDKAMVLGPMAYNSILLVIGTAGYVISAQIFNRRDLPAPV